MDNERAALQIAFQIQSLVTRSDDTTNDFLRFDVENLGLVEVSNFSKNTKTRINFIGLNLVVEIMYTPTKYVASEDLRNTNYYKDVYAVLKHFNELI